MFALTLPLFAQFQELLRNWWMLVLGVSMFRLPAHPANAECIAPGRWMLSHTKQFDLYVLPTQMRLYFLQSRVARSLSPQDIHGATAARLLGRSSLVGS